MSLITFPNDVNKYHDCRYLFKSFSRNNNSDIINVDKHKFNDKRSKLILSGLS